MTDLMPAPILRPQPSAPRPREAASGARAQDYMADAFFVALLALPFLVFHSPTPVPEAALVTRAERAAVVVAAPAAPAPARDPAVQAPAAAPDR